MRVAILWQGLSGYFGASVNALRQVPGVRVYLANEAANLEAPFSSEDVSAAGERYEWRGRPDPSILLRQLSEFNPDVLMVSSWHIASYRRAAAAFKGRAVRILCMDNQWHEQPKQWLGRYTRRVYLAPYFDHAFVTGERSAQYSRLLGFTNERTLRGLYCAETDIFLNSQPSLFARTFLFVGRLVPDKGVDILIKSYERYRRTEEDPWKLIIAGSGPFPVPDRPGIEKCGFVAPAKLPHLMSSASALVLPSRFEPWGVVVHEAAAAGLPLLCTDAVGATELFLRDGLNGYIVPRENSEILTLGMQRLQRAVEQRGNEMSRLSKLLASTWTPKHWASYVKDEVEALIHVSRRS